MQSTASYGCNMITYAEVRGEDMQPVSRSSRTANYYTFNNRTPDNVDANLWFLPYVALNRINAIIAAFDEGKITDGTEDERNDVLGQCYVLRGLFHFDLVKLFGVPYLKDKNAPGAIIADRVIAASEKLQRSTVEQTYALIVSDLRQAITLLENSKAINNGYTNYWAAEALLARVCLYMGNYNDAFTYADDVIQNGPYSLVTNANYVSSWALPFSTEAIFSIVNTGTDNGDRESIGYVALPGTGYGAFIATPTFVALLGGDPADVRLQLLKPNGSVPKGYVAKYPGLAGNYMVNNIPLIRLSEVYLTAAEAALRQSTPNQTAADTYLEAIRKRANPAATPLVATPELVLIERRKELVSEGHRFFDIMRLGQTVNRESTLSFMNTDECPTVGWESIHTYCILPVPRAEVNVNPDILPTPGYTH